MRKILAKRLFELQLEQHLLFKFEFLNGTSAVTVFKQTELAAAFLLSYRLASHHHLVGFLILIGLCGIPAYNIFALFTLR